MIHKQFIYNNNNCIDFNKNKIIKWGRAKRSPYLLGGAKPEDLVRTSRKSWYHMVHSIYGWLVGWLVVLCRLQGFVLLFACCQ